MVLYDETGTMGIIINSMTSDVTGSLFVTLLLIVIFVMAIAFMFRIPVEWTIIFVVPLLIVIMAYSSDFLAVSGVLLIYLGILIGKNWIFN